MKDEELDRILAVQKEILPSSGFTDSVMEAVRTEARTPQPIPFPWLRALPGLVAAGVMLGWLAIEALGRPANGFTQAAQKSQWQGLISLANTLTGTPVQWTALVVLFSLILARFSARLSFRNCTSTR